MHQRYKSHNGLYVDSENNSDRIESNDVLENEIDLKNANDLAINVNSNSFSDNNSETSNVLLHTDRQKYLKLINW